MYNAQSLTPVLAALKTFHGVPEAAIRDLVDAARVVELEPGQTLVEAGEPAGTGWFVARGRLRLEVGTPSRSINDVWPGEMVGEHGLFGSATTHVTKVTANTHCVLIALERSVCQSPSLRTNKAMAALQRHMLLVSARRLSAMDGNRSRVQADPNPQSATHSAPPPAPTLFGRLRSIFGGAA